MKKQQIIFFFLFLVIPGVSMAKGEITEVQTESGATSGRYALVETGENIDVNISLPVEKEALWIITHFLIHKIPSGLSEITDISVSESCDIFQKKNMPFLILCRKEPRDNADANIQISYSGKFFETKNTPFLSSGFTAGRFEMRFGERFRFFNKFHFKVTSPKKSSSTSKPEKPKKELSEEKEPKIEKEILPGQKKLATIPLHERTLKNPKSKIILDGSKNVIVAAYKIAPDTEPVRIDKLTVEILDVNTGGLYGDVFSDADMIDAVSLFYQDGSPVLNKNGSIARSVAIGSNGKVLLNNLDLVLPEGGEILFIAVDARQMLENKSGSAFTAQFSDTSTDHNIRGFWSGKQYNKSVIEPVSSANPTQYILANKLLIRGTLNQPSFLFPGRNDLLKFEAEVVGKDDIFLRQVQIELAKNSNGTEGFRVTRLRLLHENDIIASLSGADLNGQQIFVIGNCALGDICQQNGNSWHEISEIESFAVEAEILQIGAYLSGDNSLTATLEINSPTPTPGTDGAIWIDYGSGENDGVEIQWVDGNEEDGSVNRIENSISGS